jgi:hypothetical protein
MRQEPSRSSRRNDQRGRVLAVLLATAAGLTLVAGCSGSSAAKRTTGTTLITADDWSVPPVSGPPSAANFCTLLIAGYQHLGTNPRAANLRVREQIVGDFVNLEPRLVAEAPAAIKADATRYLGAVAETLAALNKVGLDSGKLRPGQLPALLTRQMQQAATGVTSYSERYCHYTIGSGTQ